MTSGVVEMTDISEGNGLKCLDWENYNRDKTNLKREPRVPVLSWYWVPVGIG